MTPKTTLTYYLRNASVYKDRDPYGILARARKYRTLTPLYFMRFYQFQSECLSPRGYAAPPVGYKRLFSVSARNVCYLR